MAGDEVWEERLCFASRWACRIKQCNCLYALVSILLHVICAFQHCTTATHQAGRENVGQLSVSSGKPGICVLWVVGEGIFKKCLYCPYTAFNILPIRHSSSSVQPTLQGKVELIFCQFSSLIQLTTSSDKCQSLFKIKK